MGTTANKIVQLDGSGKLPAVDGSQLTNLALTESGDIESVIAGTGLTGGAITGDATLAVDVGTTANKIVQLDGTGKLPAIDGSLLTNLAVTETGDIESVVAGIGLTGGATIGDATLSVDVGTTADKIVQLDGSGKLPPVDGSQLTNLVLSETGDIESVVAGNGLTGGATTGDATLAVDVGTTANKILQLDNTGKLPAVDGSQLTNLVLSETGDIESVVAGNGLTGGAITGDATLAVDVGITANKIVQLDGNGKLPAIDGSLLTNLAVTETGDIESVVAGNGLTGGAITGDATLAVDVGTTANKIVQLDSSGKLPAVDGSLLTNLAITETGDIESVVAGTGLTGGATTGDATLAVDVGTTANKIVQLDGSGRLPAVDGSQLTNLNLSETGDIESVVAGPGLTGGATTGDATLAVDVGTTANKIVQLDGSGKLPAVDGSQLTNLVLSETGDIESVVAGTGLSGGATTGDATLNVDVGTTANKIVQLDGSGKLPAVDGSRLTGIDAVDRIIGLSENLLVKSDASLPSHKINISADKVVLTNSSQQAVMHENVSVSASLASSGINGRDIGIEASNTWYYVWLISNGSSVASTLSLSATSPVLPSGYKYFHLVSSIYNDSSKNLRSFYQAGKSVNISHVYLGTFFSTTWTEVDFALYVPPIARFANIAYRCQWKTKSGQYSCYASANANGTFVTAEGVSRYESAYLLSDIQQVRQPLLTASKMWTRVNSGHSQARIWVKGFEMP